ncbi:hypothetical protein [Chroococcidiopsis sp.]|uniref:hypothetical protein n=1 Tax=Chroococcidiopsis sp. TaxID=3088168 RepID=UPI003F2A292C
MNLLENPTKSQMDTVLRQIIQSQYKDRVGAIAYKRAVSGGIEGKFKDALNPKRIFEFLIKDGELSYKVDSWDEEEDE